MAHGVLTIQWLIALSREEVSSVPAQIDGHHGIVGPMGDEDPLIAPGWQVWQEGLRITQSPAENHQAGEHLRSQHPIAIGHRSALRKPEQERLACRHLVLGEDVADRRDLDQSAGVHDAEAIRELGHQLRARVLHHAAPELGGEAGDAQVRAHRAGGGLDATTAPVDAPVIVECVTLWLSNLFERESHTPARRQQEILMAAVRDLADASKLRDVIAVSNEVGGGIVPTPRVGRRFRDLQGWANQILAEEAASVTLVVAGLPLTLKTASAR